MCRVFNLISTFIFSHSKYFVQEYKNIFHLNFHSFQSKYFVCAGCSRIRESCNLSAWKTSLWRLERPWSGIKHKLSFWIKLYWNHYNNHSHHTLSKSSKSTQILEDFSLFCKPPFNTMIRAIMFFWDWNKVPKEKEGFLSVLFLQEINETLAVKFPQNVFHSFLVILLFLHEFPAKCFSVFFLVILALPPSGNNSLSWVRNHRPQPPCYAL